MDFTDYLEESLDTSFKIKHKKYLNNVTFYYLDMDKPYRIFIEEINDDTGKHLHIGFERLIDDLWDIDAITNDLTAKEVLGLFGTIKRLISLESFNSLFFITNQSKKAQLYHNMARKLNKELKFRVQRDERAVVLSDGGLSPNVFKKVKYKKNHKVGNK